MPLLKPPTQLERLAGNVATEAALTALGALAGGPLAALLPVLGKSLAAERQRRRVEEALVAIDAMLRENERAVRDGDLNRITSIDTPPPTFTLRDGPADHHQTRSSGHRIG